MANWQTASRVSANIAPLPQQEPEAMVQIYCAKAFGWRGYFGVHSWMAVKKKNAGSYTIYQVLQWGRFYGDSVVVVSQDIPDRYWFGSYPKIIFSAKGDKAEKMIPAIEAAVASYPYPKQYRLWPGPNSNSFISHIIRLTPQLHVALPSNAIGKDWIHKAQIFALSESKTGVQFSLFGLFGLIIALIEGIEINIIGLSFGIDFLKPALKLPIIGRVGVDSGL